jgi:hypothetical protein
MAFRLKLREPLPEGLQRVFCEQIDSALNCCQNPAKQRGVTVHEVRKHLKRLRAVMRLAIGVVGKNCHAEENRCVRNIGRLVSDLRDAQVRLQTFIQLRDKAAKNSEQQLFPRIEELLLLERESFSAAFAGWQRQAIPQLENVKARLMAWPLDGLNWKNLQARPARTRQNDRRSGAGNFSRLAQASERCLVRVANFTATKPNGSGRDGSRCGGVGRITGKRARSQFSARAAGEGKR